MADHLSYPADSYLPSPDYYHPPHVTHTHAHGHIVSLPTRQEVAPRKRPKYTRSKTGCLTCRVKKIKCDESKPNCMRCTHGQRDCTWPDGTPSRKKSVARRDSLDDRPSTAGSSVSDSSTPPVRDLSPPRRLPPPEIGLPPLVSRRQSDPYPQLHSLDAPPDRDTLSRQSERGVYSHPGNSGSVSLSLIPEITAYPQARYEAYSGHTLPPLPRHPAPAGSRGMGQSVQWNSPPVLAPIHSMESYYHSLSERNTASHSSPQDSRHRYP